LAFLQRVVHDRFDGILPFGGGVGRDRFDGILPSAAGSGVTDLTASGVLRRGSS
jgi:hypothetical protein